ncbi:MAG: flagellar basal body P-ring formation chaperone FlgA [Nitrospirota bacterium]
MAQALRIGVAVWAFMGLALGWAEAAQRGSGESIPVSAKRNGFVVQPELIRQTIARHLERHFGGKAHEVRVTLLDPQEPIPAPGGALELAVLPGALQEGLGRRLFRVLMRANGRDAGTVEALADIAAYADVVAAKRLIKPDELIEADDLTLTRVKLVDLKHNFAVDMNDVIGKSAAIPIQAQSPVRLSVLRKAYVVRRGDRVTIEAKGGGLYIHTVGVSRSAGQLGQYVSVANLDSGREIKAKVVAPGVVRVDY